MKAFPIWITLDGFAPGPEVQRFLRDACPLGVILFARHLRSENQVRELCQCIHEARSDSPPLIGLDQEGGRVDRLSALGYRFPPAEEMGGDPGRVRSLAGEMGGIMRFLGFDVNFAPVADLGPAFDGTGLESRVYGSDPLVVTECCAAFLEGLDAAGMTGCLKHFPGLGGSREDSHKSLPRIEGTAEERAPHLEPYLGLAGRVPYVMVAHADYSEFGTGMPSSLDPRVYERLRRVGFRGSSLTDDLSMGAVAGRNKLTELVKQCLAAGADIALWVSSQEETLGIVQSLGMSGV